MSSSVIILLGVVMGKENSSSQKIIDLFLIILICFGIYVCFTSYKELGLTISVVKIFFTILVGIAFLIKNIFFVTVSVLLLMVVSLIKILFYDTSVSVASLIVVLLCAFVICRSIMQTCKGRASYFYYKGLKFCKKGNYEKAIEYGNKAAAFDYPAGELFFYLGISYQFLNKPQDAINNYTLALKKGFQTSNVFFNRALVYQHLKKYDNAIEDINKAYELRPDDENICRVREELLELTSKN